MDVRSHSVAKTELLCNASASLVAPVSPMELPSAEHARCLRILWAAGSCGRLRACGVHACVCVPASHAAARCRTQHLKTTTPVQLILTQIQSRERRVRLQRCRNVGRTAVADLVLAFVRAGAEESSSVRPCEASLSCRCELAFAGTNGRHPSPLTHKSGHGPKSSIFRDASVARGAARS